MPFRQQGVEAGDEPAVAVGLVDPPTGLGIFCQRLGVDALGREHRDAGGVGAEARTVLADVGIGARTLGWGAQAVAAGEAGLEYVKKVVTRCPPVVGGGIRRVTKEPGGASTSSIPLNSELWSNKQVTGMFFFASLLHLPVGIHPASPGP